MEQGTHIGCGHSGPASWCRMLVSALALVAPAILRAGGRHLRLGGAGAGSVVRGEASSVPGCHRRCCRSMSRRTAPPPPPPSNPYYPPARADPCRERFR